MHLLDAIQNRRSAPVSFVNGLPKAGTHLLRKALELFPGIRYAHARIDPEAISPVTAEAVSQSETIPIGIDWPRAVLRRDLEKVLGRLEHGQFVQAHACFSHQLVDLLSEMQIKAFLILRDPRDVVISHANFVVQRPQHFLYQAYSPLSESDRIMTSIVGIRPTTAGEPVLLNICERYQTITPWLSHPINYTTYFEKLVGPRGGGSADAQLREISNIAQHLGLRHSARDIDRVAERIFGGTFTFRKGHTGAWQSKLTDDHKQAIKKIAGQLLIDLGYEDDYDW
ncbi:MAG: hypothetical protein JXA14_26975 [Anaerolineae bacterium]|nr:hypothetical protein [Anaerolineae bacterium]